MAGTVISGSLTELGSGGGAEKRWTGKSHKNCWWNSWQSRWDGVLRYDESGALSTNGDNWIAKAINGSVSWTSLELDDRQSGRICIFWDDAGKTLHAIGFHDTTCEYWEIDYNSGSDTYSFTVGSAGSGETVTGISRSADGTVNTGSIYVVPNGDVWVALLTNSGLELNRRTGGSWNGSTVNLDNTLDEGVVTLNHFVDSGTTYVYVFSTEDDAVTNSEWNAYYIDEDHASPFTAGNWTEDTIVAQTEFSTDADNHCDSVRDSSENIYIVLKTGSAATGETLIGVLKRTSGGTYTSHEVYQKQASSADDRTRPVIALDATNSKLYVAYSKETTGDLDAWYVTADLSDLDTWDSETDLFVIATRDFNNLRSPQQDFNATNTTNLLFLAAQDAAAGTVFDDDIYYTLVTIAAVGGVTNNYYYRMNQ